MVSLRPWTPTTERRSTSRSWSSTPLHLCDAPARDLSTRGIGHDSDETRRATAARGTVAVSRVPRLRRRHAERACVMFFFRTWVCVFFARAWREGNTGHANGYAGCRGVAHHQIAMDVLWLAGLGKRQKLDCRQTSFQVSQVCDGTKNQRTNRNYPTTTEKCIFF